MGAGAAAKPAWRPIRLAGLAMALTALAIAAPNDSRAQDPRYPDRAEGRAQVLGPDVIAIGNHLIQLFGIDAPEERQPCHTPSGETWNCSVAATKTLLDLVGDYEVTCEARMPPRRRRIYAECFVADTNINEAMVQAGMAMVVREETEAYLPAEEAARAEGRGIWQGEMMAPWDFRKTPAGQRQPRR